MRSCTAANRALASVPRHTMIASPHMAACGLELLDDSRTCRVLQICTRQMLEICVNLVRNSGSPPNNPIVLSLDVPRTLQHYFPKESTQLL
jgi:hypothetical protein